MLPLKELVRGFLWGIGFSLAIGGVALAYYLNYHAYVQQTQQGIVEHNVKLSMQEIYRKYDPYVIDIYKDGRYSVRVTVGVRNVTEEELKAKGIIISFFDKKGKFLAHCPGQSVNYEILPKGEIYYDVSCRLYKRQVENVEKATVAVRLL